MKTLNLTLTKVRNYNLKPFGRFAIKRKASEKANQKVGIIYLPELTIYYETGMPCDDVDKQIIKFMVKHKTDVLVDDSTNYYTRVGAGITKITKISHTKLRLYNTFLRENGGKDNLKMWEAWQRENNEI
jgi:hypothetical protein